MKYLSILSLLLIILSACDSTTSDKNSSKEGLVPDGHELVWQDEFNEPVLDLTKWNYETGTGINGDWGTGQLDRATNRPENVKITSGVQDADGNCLSIITRKENYRDRNYTSGRINTSGKGSWGPGYRIEARIKPAGVNYKGQGFAFWMMPASKPATETTLMWPQGGEIDIMEYVGSIPYHNLGSVHYAWQWLNNEYADWNHGYKGNYYSFASGQVPSFKPEWGGYPVEPGTSSAGNQNFHRYAIEWYTDRMEFEIDGNVYHIHYFNDGGFSAKDGEDKEQLKTVNGRQIYLSEYSNHFQEWQPFENPFFIILSGGVGGADNKTYGGAIVPEAVFPCEVYVDWVRVSRRK